MGVYRTCRKWTVLAFNFILLVVGATLVGIGSTYIKNDLSKAIPSSYHYFSLIPILLIVVGSILVLVAIFGSFGVFQKNICLLSIHTFALVLIFILHIILTVVTFVEVSNQGNLATSVNKTLDELFINKTNPELVDHIQVELECCGTFGPKFWGTPDKVPKSCCEAEDCTKLTYQDGCQNEFYYFLLRTVRIMGISMLVLSIIQVINAVFSLSLTNSIRNDNRRYGRYVSSQMN